MIMFIPQASPVVNAYMTWHIGPTTCVSSSRSFACFERLATGSEASQACISSSCPSIQCENASACAVSAKRNAEARVIRSLRRGAEATRLADGACAAVEGDREAALGVGERDVDAFLGAAALDEASLGLLERVVAELDVDRPDDRHRDERDAGDRLRRACERRQVVGEDLAVAVEPRRELLLPRADESGSFLRGQRRSSTASAYRLPGAQPGEPARDVGPVGVVVGAEALPEARLLDERHVDGVHGEDRCEPEEERPPRRRAPPRRGGSPATPLIIGFRTCR